MRASADSAAGGTPPDDAVTERPGRGARALALAWYPVLFVATLLAAYVFTGLSEQSWRVPINYTGDALSGGSQFKGTLETGWYESNPALGAPWGQTFHDFPLADNVQFVAAHVIGWFTDSFGVAGNAYYLVGYPLAAVAGAWFVRLVGGSRVTAFAAGVLYAFAPYHFVRNEGHLSLASYYPVPFAAGVVYLALAGEPLWTRRAGSGSRWNPWSWSTGRTWGTTLALVLIASASSYYSVFTLFFLAAVFLARVLATRTDAPGVLARVRAAGRSARDSVLAGALLVLVMLANMAPDLWYAHDKPTNFIGLTRVAVKTERYSFKLAQLVLPVDWERFGPLRRLRASYDATFPLPSERPFLGLVAAVGFLILLFVAVLSVVRTRSGATDTDADTGPGPVLRRLGFLTLVGFLIGTIGGFSTLFTLFVSEDIRGWNRIAIFLSLFALAALALLLDAGAARVVRRGLAPVVTGVVALVAVAVGLYDQVPPVSAATAAIVTKQYDGDAAYVRAIEQRMPAGAMVYQEPYEPFPEAPAIRQMATYDPMRLYLHSTDLRWSYGGVRGRPRADWAEEVDQHPLPRRLVEIAAAGFRGLHVDRAAYTPEQDQQLEAQLTRLAGEPAVVSRDGRFVFYDLTAYAARVRAAFPADQLAAIGSHATDHPVGYPQRDFERLGRAATPADQVLVLSSGSTGSVFVDNPRSGADQVRIEMSLSTRGASRTVRVVWPDGVRQQVAVGPDPTPVERTLSVRTGRTELRLSGVARLRITGFAVHDVMLDGWAAPAGLTP